MLLVNAQLLVIGSSGGLIAVWIFRRNYLLRFLLTTFLVVAFPVYVRASNFEEALIKKVVNDVYLYDDITVDEPERRAARKKDVLRPKMGLRTAPESRAELVFKDGSLVRVGSDAMLSFTPKDRRIQVSSGSVFLQQSQSGPETQIQTATMTASITGTTMMLRQFETEGAQGSSKTSQGVVIEGEMNVALKNNPQSQRTLTSGDMIIVPENAQRLPEPVKVNLSTLTSTSGLMQDVEEDDDEAAGDDEGEVDREPIEEAVREQQEKIEEGELENTNIVITDDGEGTLDSSEDLTSGEVEQELQAVDDTDQDLNESEQELETVDLSQSSDFEYKTDGKSIEFTGDGSSAFDLDDTTKDFIVDTQKTDQTANITMDKLAINAQTISITSRAGGEIEVGDVNLTSQGFLELFADGNASAITFVDNTSLTSPPTERITLAGETVEVEDGVDVTVETGSGGIFEIFANNKNYNVDTISNGSYGKFSVNPGGTVNEDSFDNF